MCVRQIDSDSRNGRLPDFLNTIKELTGKVRFYLKIYILSHFRNLEIF